MPASSATATGPTENIAAIILAAGKSTRMRSKLPKPLHPLCGLPLTAHVMRACRDAGVQRTILVIGHEAEAVRARLGEDLEYAYQDAPRGTGHAVLSASPLFKSWNGTVLVLAGDVPLLPMSTIRRLVDHHLSTNAAATMLTARLEDPTGYGRVIRDQSGGVVSIVEHRDASPEQREVKEWNPSIYAFKSDALW